MKEQIAKGAKSKRSKKKKAYHNVSNSLSDPQFDVQNNLVDRRTVDPILTHNNSKNDISALAGANNALNVSYQTYD